MALENPHIYSSAIMLDAIPDLTGRLDIKTVPITFIEEHRFDGPLNEWIMVQQVDRIAGE